jgi:hypothetical protein
MKQLGPVLCGGLPLGAAVATHLEALSRWLAQPNRGTMRCGKYFGLPDPCEKPRGHTGRCGFVKGNPNETP